MLLAKTLATAGPCRDTVPELDVAFSHRLQRRARPCPARPRVDLQTSADDHRSLVLVWCLCFEGLAPGRTCWEVRQAAACALDAYTLTMLV